MAKKEQAKEAPFNDILYPVLSEQGYYMCSDGVWFSDAYWANEHELELKQQADAKAQPIKQ